MCVVFACVGDTLQLLRPPVVGPKVALLHKHRVSETMLLLKIVFLHDCAFIGQPVNVTKSKTRCTDTGIRMGLTVTIDLFQDDTVSIQHDGSGTRAWKIRRTARTPLSQWVVFLSQYTWTGIHLSPVPS